MKEILNRAWNTWKRVGQAIGDFIARIVLTIFYFSLLLPFGIGVRLFSDPLNLRTKEELGWKTEIQLEEGLTRTFNWFREKYIL